MTPSRGQSPGEHRRCEGLPSVWAICPKMTVRFVTRQTEFMRAGNGISYQMFVWQVRYQSTVRRNPSGKSTIGL